MHKLLGVLVVLFLASPLAVAQEEPAAKKDAKKAEKKKVNPLEQEDESKLVKLPSPFDRVLGNVKEFEKDGMFKVVKIRYAYLRSAQRYGIVWTLEAKKRITYRHALLYMKKFRDVRFYKKYPKFLTEVHSALLHFSQIFLSESANGRALSVGDRFETWIYISDLEKRVIKQKANRVLLRQLK